MDETSDQLRLKECQSSNSNAIDGNIQRTDAGTGILPFVKNIHAVVAVSNDWLLSLSWRNHTTKPKKFLSAYFQICPPSRSALHDILTLGCRLI